MEGSVIGEKYRIIRLLGAGGMGAVYEAEDTDHGTRVALKVVTADSARDETLLSRFEREARAVAALSTPHIVHVLDLGRDGETGLPYMVMEQLVGEDLQQLLKRQGPLPWEAVLRIGAQACRGLQKAHDQQIIHRDIKPANLYLAKGGGGARTVKLLDFGVAKIAPNPSETGNDPENLTRTGAMLGSPAYMAPEQARGSKDIDHRADLWSLGVVLYKALSGRTPHQGTEALGELIVSICTEPPAPLQQCAPWVPPEVAALVHGALRLDPNERFQSADAMRAAIEAIVPDQGAIAASLLRPLSEADRVTAKQLVLTPDRLPQSRAALMADTTSALGPGSLGAFGTTVSEGDRTNVFTPNRVDAPPKRTGLLLVVGLMTAIAGGSLVVALRGASTPTATPATSAPASAAASKPARVRLVIIPSNAQVEVNGAKVPSPDGLVALEGALGSVQRVRVLAGAHEETHDVVITEGGAMPPKIDIAATAAEGPSSAKVLVAPAGGTAKTAPKSGAAPSDIRIRR